VSLKLYFHPLASFCHKALIALYERGIAFEPVIVDLGNEKSRSEFAAIWPMAKMPVLRDEARDCTVAESTIVIEYLDVFYAGAVQLIPMDHDRAWQARMWDRFYDHYVHHPMQAIVADRLRPAGKSDPFGVEQAKGQLLKAHGIIDNEMASKTWAMGDELTLADCAAAPALFYANTVLPLEAAHKNVSTYLDRLMKRQSIARVLKEAEPYFAIFPLEPKPQIKSP